MQLKNNKCAYFQFLALYQAKGLGSSVDGILGLANHHDPAKKHFNFVQQLKDSGIIK